MLLKALICDDEAPARDELRFLLEEAGGVEIVNCSPHIREWMKQEQKV